MISDILEEAGDSFGRELLKTAARAAVKSAAKKAASETARIVVNGVKEKCEQWTEPAEEATEED